jgi:protein-L-isoaspartate(D-aspartate) O-methyltransferase
MRSSDAVHQELVDRLISRGALWSPDLIAAFRATPRHRFLDQVYHHRDGGWHVFDPDHLNEEDLRLIYSDRALTTRLSRPDSPAEAVAISSSSQPSLMAQMLEDLQLQPGQHVLEIGAGTGYNAALIAHVIAGVREQPGRLVSIDVDHEVLAGAWRHLAWFHDRRIELHHGDGRIGFPAAAPFDRIQVTAATTDLEPAWLEQLVPGGLVQAPLDLAPGLAFVVQGAVTDGLFTGGLTRPAYFMPLRDEGEAGRDRNSPDSPLPGPERLHGMPAPWANWPDRRPSGEGEEFLPSLAFLAWLEGRSLGYAACPDGRAGHGIVDLVAGQACWMDPQEWRVSGKGGYEMGWSLWRRWLDLGGPRPEEWRLSVARDKELLPQRCNARLTFDRRGGRCVQRWELIEPRTRRNMG